MALKEIQALPELLNRLLLLQIHRKVVAFLLGVLYDLINETDALNLFRGNHFFELRVELVAEGHRQIIAPHIRQLINHLHDLVPLAALVVVGVDWAVQGVEDDEIVGNRVVEILQFLQLLLSFDLESGCGQERAGDHGLSENHLVFIVH